VGALKNNRHKLILGVIMEETFTGTITALGFNFAPRSWSACIGNVMSIQQNTALFSLLGIQFGGDGRQNFALPDLRGRSPIGQGRGNGLRLRQMGEFIGQETQTLNESNLANHSHAHSYIGATDGGPTTVTVAKGPGKKSTPNTGDYLAPPANTGGAITAKSFLSPPDAVSAGLVEIGGVRGGDQFNNASLQIRPTGENAPFDVMQPSLVINYCICVSGQYPARSF
jgi:microcystin-dependent protein